MKILTVLGTRPEIIRLSLIIKKLDLLADQHILVHTGQNYTNTLSQIFFQELDVRLPDYTIKLPSYSLGNQLAGMFSEIEAILLKEKPDKVLVLGDTNSALVSLLAERMNIPVVHMEAGNRCFDLKVPEEKNRKIIDTISSFNLPYTPQSRENLLREGFPVQRIMVSGNPIYEVLTAYSEQIEKSSVLDALRLENKDYFLVTAHRAENVDDPANLNEILSGLNIVAEQHQKRVICSVHPRTKQKISALTGLAMNPLVEFHEPFGFFDFIKLEKNALCVLTDSGTVQEECCLFHVPAVTMRNSTERPETVECGSNSVSGVKSEYIAKAVQVMLNQKPEWDFPEGYKDPHVSEKVVKFLLGGKKVV
ncbi:non-hydrolyzing UDP-N-acetylglucosamine 2-epimerase [Fictibacillus aquaticus]|uniref:UDP-N-acetylglucosamine 2-epimerase (Non-hydrolyzing) n=1 Tax=Fictibacillus aquaticus TaxID=2021314 RepID=A0A235FCT2_9BACL|nr:UDP-N-acetylglucosamine 2-epimerase (non-hydrolyzing) [Fictibacillus aquaticus]OYD59042.1 UDP-N-acetylglucosamine 2-epimerase (non-hydrolyzing) [Fictibacillus aquaticus]